MDDAIERKVRDLLAAHTAMTIATLRADGWPQATMVGYAHEGLTLYFLCDPGGQKAKNIAADPRVSLTIGSEDQPLLSITGLSMAARAAIVADPAEKHRILGLLASRYPAQDTAGMPMPPDEAVCIVRVEPVVISVIDYTKGFGHTDLITLG